MDARLIAEPQGRTGVLDVLMELGKRRAATMLQMRGALEAGDDGAALDLARLLCGLMPERKSAGRVTH